MKIETLRKLITEEIKYTEVLDKEDYILFIYNIQMRFIHFGCWNNGGCDLENPEKNDFYDNMDFLIPNYEKAVIYSFMITSAFNACHARGAGFSGITKTNKLKVTTLINKLKKELKSF